ncbi:hypothetical protein MTO96_021093 [Rhipicephalus appendiculatus]
MAALLPCLHVVCKTCYDQCRLNDGNSCPLDGSLCSDEDVDWRDFPADTLLRQQVKCWNEDNGCEVVTSAFKLHEHFLQDCDYHTTSCLNQGQVELAQSRVAFWKQLPELPPVGAVERILIAHGDRLTELSRSVSSLGATLNQAVEDAKRTSIEKLEQNASDLRMLHADVSEHMTGSTDVLEEITQSLSEFKGIPQEGTEACGNLEPRNNCHFSQSECRTNRTQRRGLAEHERR